MKKLFLLTKTLLVMALLGMGSMNVWAETINVNSTESAYVLKSSETNFDGASNALVAYYTQYRNWGTNDGTANFRNNDAKLVLYKFSLADFKSANGSLTSVTFTFHTTSTENCYNIFAVGYKEDWSASTVTGNNLANNVGTITGVVSATGSFQPLGTGYAGLSNGSKETDISIDATDYVQSAIDADLDYVSFAVGINLMRNLPLNTTAKLSGEFTVAAATTYTVKYQNASGVDLKDAVVYDTYVGESYTASASDMASFNNGDNSKKYIYSTGNASKTATSTASDNVITLVFNEYDKVAYTLTAKDGDTTLGTLAEGNAYTDGSTTIYWSKFKNFNGQWYETTANYGKTITAAGNTDVAFATSDIAYFYEFETLSRSGGSGTVTENDISRSNNTVGRIANSSGSYATLYTPELSGGVYTLYMPYYNGNGVGDDDKIYVYVTNNVSELGNPVETFNIEKTNTGNFSTTVTVPTGYFIAFQGAKVYSHNSKARIDYLTLTKSSDLVSLIGLNGNWADDILMTHGEGDVYTATVEGFAAKAGINYEYKLRDYGTWDSFQFPAQGKGNKSFSVAEDGIYTLTFTADISTGAVTVEPNKTGAYANGKVVTFVNTAGWNENSVHAWAWTDEVGSNAESWPGVEIKKVGTFQGYDVFAYSYETKYDKIIFNNGNSGDSNQTGNLTFTDGEQYSYGNILPYYTVTYTNPGNWDNVYAYTWTTKGGSDENAAWPGVQMTQTENGYVYGVHAATPPTKIIFNDGGSNQTDNLKFYNGLTYSFGAKGSTVPVTITAAGYATYASAATLNFTGSEITSYVATDDGNWVTFTEEPWVPAGTGILLKAAPGTYNIPTVTSQNEDYEVESALVGVVKETTIEGAGIFVLMADPEVGFYKTTADAFTVGANTAYIPADVAPSRTFIGIDGNTTGISERVSDTTGEKCYYNLNGQRLTTPKKGLNIVNGQKFINK